MSTPAVFAAPRAPRDSLVPPRAQTRVGFPDAFSRVQNRCVVRASSASGDKAPASGRRGRIGFVGSRVCDALKTAGVADVVSVSKSGGPGGVAIDLSDACVTALTDAMKGADCVVSCVGVFKPAAATPCAGNRTYNVRVVDAAVAAKVGRFVYVSVVHRPGRPGRRRLRARHGRILRREEMAEEAIAARSRTRTCASSNPRSSSAATSSASTRRGSSSTATSS